MKSANELESPVQTSPVTFAYIVKLWWNLNKYQIILSSVVSIAVISILSMFYMAFAIMAPAFGTWPTIVLMCFVIIPSFMILLLRSLIEVNRE